MVLTEVRIREWYDHWDGDIYVSFSGGKDSTVLLHIARSIFPSISAMFVDTGLEYPEIREFVSTIENVTKVKPEMPFKQVIEKYGYPIISKEQAQYIRQYRTQKSEKTKDTRWNGNKYGRGKISEKWKFLVDAPFKISEQCCDVIKKKPAIRYEKETGNKAMIAVMAQESCKRTQDFQKFGCNAFSANRPMSRPMGFWLEQDILSYIKRYNIPYASIYGEIVEGSHGALRCTGESRTGCMFCAFGRDFSTQPNKFQRMKKTHPKIYEYCMDKLGMRDVLEFTGIPY